ncbi:hypothetical protein GIB67_019146 [Kingdonia uniflora]|uniref:Uncharacterized protein n=1 Tax=Kingdonia uniflora TaxID=39325 RepID=A0A7J7MZW3_9MAGN|nr:hypothetical protein GIB67_019146 [Kingdonia uniflora]
MISFCLALPLYEGYKFLVTKFGQICPYMPKTIGQIVPLIQQNKYLFEQKKKSVFE